MKHLTTTEFCEPFNIIEGDLDIKTVTIDSESQLRELIGTAPSGIQVRFRHDVAYHLSGPLNIEGLHHVRFVGPVTFARHRVLVRDCYEVHFENIRFRLGNEGGAEDCCSVYLSERCGLKNCSGAWSVDEVFSLSKSRHCYIEDCILAYPLNNSVHPKGEHGLISVLDGNQLRFERNYCAHALFRPEIVGSANVRDCIFYDYRQFPVIARAGSKVDVVCNLFATGPANPNNYRAVWCSGSQVPTVYARENVLWDRSKTIVAGTHVKVDSPQNDWPGPNALDGRGTYPRDQLDGIIIDNWVRGEGGLIDRPEDLPGGWDLANRLCAR